MFEIVLPNPANVDLATMVFKPPLTIAKTSAAYSDLVNGTANPKLIPGGRADYLITVTSPAAYAASANSIAIVNATPWRQRSGGRRCRGGRVGTGGVVQGAPLSTLPYAYAGAASQTDDIDFSRDGGASWNYVPVANTDGVDTGVTNVRLRPKGSMAASSSFTFRLTYRVR